jgi:hypothetical protein
VMDSIVLAEFWRRRWDSGELMVDGCDAPSGVCACDVAGGGGVYRRMNKI